MHRNDYALIGIGIVASLLILIPLGIGLADAQVQDVVITKGQNYDLIENFIIGEAKWTSHPERIMDGGWQNYALTNNAEIIAISVRIFNHAL